MLVLHNNQLLLITRREGGCLFSRKGRESRSKKTLKRFNVGGTQDARDKAGDAGAGHITTQFQGGTSLCNLCNCTLRWPWPSCPMLKRAWPLSSRQIIHHGRNALGCQVHPEMPSELRWHHELWQERASWPGGSGRLRKNKHHRFRSAERHVFYQPMPALPQFLWLESNKIKMNSPIFVWLLGKKKTKQKYSYLTHWK